MSSDDEIRTLANECFNKKEFEKANSLYSEAMEKFGLTPVLLTNRAAAKLALGEFISARDDASKAIALDNTFVKAYYRKAIAEEKLNLEADRYATCAMCYQLCEHSPWLKNFMKASETRWKKMYKSCSITDADDFLARYEFAPTGRDRLSTMAHFWNVSKKEERLQHFHLFLGLVGGGTVDEKYVELSASLMPDMPMQNYEDMLAEDIPSWIAFFKSLSSPAKTELMKKMYLSLTHEEQGLVISDLGVFINMALSGDVKKTDMHASDTYSLGATGQLLTNRNRDAMKGNSNDMASFDEDLTQEDADEMEALKAVKSWKKNFG